MDTDSLAKLREMIDNSSVREPTVCKMFLLALDVVAAARPLGASIFIDKRVWDEARFQVRQAIDRFDRGLSPERTTP